MDFDSLNISKSNNVQNSFSADYGSVGKTADIKVSEEKVKTNAAELKTDVTDQKQQQKNGKVQEDGKGVYKGNYKEDMENAVRLANEKLRKSTNKQFSYSIHEATKQVMITIKDSDGKVIKEVPSEESLDFFAKLQELSGILLDEKR